MPELPEVETIRKNLASLAGDQVISCSLGKPLRAMLSKSQARLLSGQTLHNPLRRSKWLVLPLSKGCLLLHLGMSGRALLRPTAAPRAKHDHFTLNFSSGRQLVLNDPRRFGAAVYHPQPFSSFSAIPQLANLGPEPLESSWGAKRLFADSRDSRKPAKLWLMDNAHVVGIGNIYASEILFLSKIHPLAPMGDLTLPKCALIAKTAKKVLREAILHGGSTLRDFRHADGSQGHMQNRHLVYNKAKSPCPSCKKEPIASILLGGRSSFFCPACQKI